jgi:hypothetical protein
MAARCTCTRGSICTSDSGSEFGAPVAFAYDSDVPGLMRRLPPQPSLLLTLGVALATLLGLALPEGIGGRDSVVRLTRGGMQRLGHPDTVSHDHDDSDTAAGDPGGGHRASATSINVGDASDAVVPVAPVLTVLAAVWTTIAPGRPSPLATTLPPPSRGRAPPRA